MNTNDIIEKCAEITDKWAKDLESAGNQFDHEGNIYRVAGVAQQIATAIRALKSSPPAETLNLDLDTASEFKQLFDLRHAADMRAIERWQKHTGQSHVLPDHADLCVWLLERLEAAESSKGGDANEPETLPGLDKSSPGVTAGASPAETVSEATLNEACAAYEAAFVHGNNNWRNQMRAALEAASFASADDGWRPISEAPKDGKAFLASSNGWLTLACWNRHRNGWCCVAPGYPNFPFDEQPTHFMSLQALPAPPKDGRE